MKILEIIGSVDPRHGGAIEGLVRQAAVRERRGCHTEIASLDPPDAPWVRDCPVRTFGFGPAAAGGRGAPFRRFGYTPTLVPWLRAHRSQYDVVVVNGLWNYATLAARRSLPLFAPYVVFPHGMLDPWFRRDAPFKHVAKQLLWLASEGPLLRNAAAVLFTAEDEMTSAENAFWPYSVRGQVVGYGTADVVGSAAEQIAAFRARVPRLAGRPFLLFLGRLHLKKGCDILVEAFCRVAADCPEVDLVMAGPDPADLRPRLETAAAAMGLAGRIHWPGMLVGDAKWGALRGCAALTLPSHQENFGVVVTEALAAGRPVLISDRVNIWREVKTFGAGLVGRDDVDGTAAVLRRFLSLSDDAVAGMSEAARNCFVARFDINRAANEICDVLEDVTRSWHAGSAKSLGR
ncbi:glycosyltransferase [Bradyrhizobium sp. HKCCYLS3077]|uniref:glycosyltransferase n=1 Tax=Bradyrhizobium sp. HKCCYLS3077 TaxID=3420761 RepID=UPI003EBD57D1